MKKNKGNQQCALVALLSSAMVSGCASIGGTGVLPTSQTSDNDRLRQPTFYAGIGAGISQLEPDTSEVDGVDVSDSNDTGAQLTLGLDVSKHLSLELHYATLGSAEISPAGSISYETFGGSALIYAGKNRGNFKRHGLLGFGRIGFGMLDNSAEGGVSFVQENEGHLLLGGGLEYMTRSGLGVRGEVIAFDTDVLYSQLGLIYRFGRRGSNRTEPLVDEKALIAPAAVETTPVPVVEEPIVESMAEPGPDVIAACSELASMLEGINFRSNSDVLSSDSEVILEEVADVLSEKCDRPVRILAHTDNIGSAEYNLDLSSRRARAVARALVQNGIDVKRLEALAFGASRPIDTNDTPEGRSRNRRVEIVIK